MLRSPSHYNENLYNSGYNVKTEYPTKNDLLITDYSKTPHLPLSTNTYNPYTNYEYSKSTNTYPIASNTTYNLGSTSFANKPHSSSTATF